MSPGWSCQSFSKRSVGRSDRAAANLAGPWPADRLGRDRTSPRRPGNLSSVARRAARDRHPQVLSGAGRDPRMSGNCELGRGLRRREKNANEAGAGRFEKPAPDARAAPPEAHESLIGRKTVEEVPLTGLSFILSRRAWGGSASCLAPERDEGRDRLCPRMVAGHPQPEDADFSQISRDCAATRNAHTAAEWHSLARPRRLCVNLGSNESTAVHRGTQP